MNRKAFIAMLLALLFPWRKKADVFSNEEIETKWRAWAPYDWEMEARRQKLIEYYAKKGKDFQPIRDAARPHHLGYYVHEVAA